MAEPIYRTAHDLDPASEATPAGGVPGKMPVTARLSGRSQIIFRVESAEAARELAGAFGPRDSNGVAAGSDAAVDRAASSSGQALPDDVRGRFESSLGTDLSGVRVHTGDASAQAASAVGAKAYTTGNDIHFGAGQYDPSSAFGVHLLAHEVAHTVQQQGTAPTRQNKLEVSAPQDAAEVEADHAADAMVTGAPAALAASSGLPRKALYREQINPVTIGPDQSLNQTLHDQQQGTQKNLDQNWDFTGTDLVDPKTGLPNANNEVAKNLAKKDQKTQEAMKRLSEELDSVRPLTQAYLMAQTNVDTLIATGGIDANNPEAYRADVLAMHEAMDKKTSTNSNESNASTQLTNLWSQAQTSKNVLSATKKLSAITDELQIAKNELSKIQNNLIAAKLKDEIKANQGELAKIDAKIKKISDIITGIAKVTAAIASMAATGGATAPGAIDAMASTLSMEQSFALVAMQNAHDSEAEANANTTKGAAALGGLGKAGEWVGGKGDMIEKGLQSYVFKEQIDGFKTKITALEGDIGLLGIKNDGLNVDSVVRAIDKAQKNYEAAAADLANSKDKFQQSMQAVGKVYDRMHIDDKTPEGKAEASIKSPGIAPGRKVSMEVLMGLYASLQKRGAAREGLKDMLKNCKTIPDAKAVMAAALDDSAGHPMMVENAWFGNATKSVAMDQDFSGLNLRSKEQIAHAAEVRRTVASVLTVLDHVAARDKGESGVEAGWETVVSEGMKGIKGA